MKELKVGERIILEVVEVNCISCQDCFLQKKEKLVTNTALLQIGQMVKI